MDIDINFGHKYIWTPDQQIEMKAWYRDLFLATDRYLPGYRDLERVVLRSEGLIDIYGSMVCLGPGEWHRDVPASVFPPITPDMSGVSGLQGAAPS